jgi:hypothetical protein
VVVALPLILKIALLETVNLVALVAEPHDIAGMVLEALELLVKVMLVVMVQKPLHIMVAAVVEAQVELALLVLAPLVEQVA